MGLQPLGIAVVGTGFGQKIHLPGFQHHHRTQVVALYHRDRTKAAQIAQTHQIPFYSDDLGEILARPEVQGVAISTPPFLHEPMARQTLEAGKHLLLEKPLAMNADQVRDLYHLAQDRGLTAIADFEFRFVPAWQYLAQLLQEGYVGQPRLIKIDWLVSSRANPQLPWNWYAQEAMGGGVLGAIGSHAFDYVHWLFGPIARIAAQLSCAIRERPDPLAGNQRKPVTADDTNLILLELADGTPCQIALSSVTAAPRSHGVEVYGDRGTLILASHNAKDYVHGFELRGAPLGESLQVLAIPDHLEFPQTFTDGRLAPFVRVVDCWVQGIEQGRSPTPSLREGAYSQLMMDLARQSHRERRWLTVPDLDAWLP